MHGTPVSADPASPHYDSGFANTLSTFFEQLDFEAKLVDEASARDALVPAQRPAFLRYGTGRFDEGTLVRWEPFQHPLCDPLTVRVTLPDGTVTVDHQDALVASERS